MLLKKCSVEEFSRRTQNKKIICFGAYVMPVGMCNTYRMLHLEERIVFLADNDVNKQGQNFDLCGYSRRILSPDELVEKTDADTVILITSGYYVAIIDQLEQYPELEQTECYVYPLMRSLYPSHEKVKVRHTETPQIPRIIHYFWFGKKEKPDIVKRCIESWHKFCPDYEIKEWNEDNYDVSKNRFSGEAYREGKWAFVTDYARLDVIYANGGIYFDTDVEVIRTLDDLLYNKAFFGMGNYGRIATGLGFGSIRESLILKELLAVYENKSFYRVDGEPDLTTNTMKETPVFEKRGFVQEDKFQMIEGMVIFPSEVFSPNVPGTDVTNITENTFSIHHNAFSWASDQERIQYNNSIQGTRAVIARMSDL